MPPELHARSAFSFLRGASQPEDMVARAAELGIPAIAIADHGGFQGSARAHYAAKKHGIRAIVATTLELPSGDLPILVRTATGYRDLSHHLTNLHLAPDLQTTNHLPPQNASNLHELHSLHGKKTPPTSPDLIALTGDTAGPIHRALASGQKDIALHTATSLRDHFGRENLYVQLTRHQLRGEDRVNRLLIDLARHLKLPLIASNAPLFATPADRLLGDAFTCLRHHTNLDQAGRLLAPNGQRHLKSPQQMCELFADIPEAIDNAYRLADRIEFSLENLGYQFPALPGPSGHPLSLPEQATELRRRVYARLRARYGKVSRKLKKQIEHELALVQKLGFPGYFLIVHELIEFARGEGILCQGRGSAANSALCYALGITSVDPVGGGLLFERFLSENRKSWPDIDIDFPSGDRRESVIQHVFQRFGERGAAMTANVITYRARSAFREMSKVLGFPESIADRFSDICSSPKIEDPHEALETEDATSPMDQFYTRRVADFEETIAKSGVPTNHPRQPALMKLLTMVDGMPRHLGQHSGGMIICDRGLDKIVPIQPASMPSRTIVQWDKDDCEDLGIVKVDLLGLGMLAAMEDSIKICADRGKTIDLALIPKDDPKTFALLQRADTIGTFQVESRAQMATLPILKPRNFYDVAVEVAIIRPGPIVGDLVHPYLNRRTGREPVDYIHPDFEPILKRTLGVPLFQEQVLKMAMVVAGFDGSEADELRRAMSFKRSDERMQHVAERLQHRMTERGIDADTQKRVIDSIGSFALYGFPESHAISFALIAYGSCWLKAHHPAEFYTGLINNQPMGFYNVNTLIRDAKHHRIRVFAPSVVSSEQLTTVIDDTTIRLGLRRLKGLSKSSIERITSTRAKRPFTSLADFLHRAQPNKKERRLLARSGSLNDLPDVTDRRTALWDVERPLQLELFASLKPDDTAKPPSVLPTMSSVDRLESDFVTQGHTVGPHPMVLMRETLDKDNPAAGSLRTSGIRANTLHYFPHGTSVTIAGLVICRQRPGTAKGHCFISLEDETGIANLFVPRDTFQKHRLLITTERFLIARGILQIGEGEVISILVKSIQAIKTPAQLPTRSHDFH